MLLTFTLTALFAAQAFADPIAFTPTGFPTPNDGSVWNIDVSSGAMGAGTFEGWCYSSLIGGYDEGADFGHNFLGTSTTDLNDTSFYGSNPGTKMAGALVNYLVENYYGFWTGSSSSGASTKERYGAFHDLLWEIADDYDPSVGIASLSLSSGNYETGGYISPTASILLSDLNAAFSSLSPTYTSSSYDLHVVEAGGLSKDGSPLGYDKQPLMLIVPVPEPGTSVLGLGVGAMFMLRRSRKPLGSGQRTL